MASKEVNETSIVSDDIKVVNTADSIKSNLEEGFSCCEYCNFVGRSESFFSKSKRFCSCVCSRSYSSSKRDKSNHSHSSKSYDKKRLLLAKNLKNNSGLITRDSSLSIRTEAVNKSFEWGPYLDKENATAAPVSSFKHCQMNEFWQSIIINMKVEVLNTDANSSDGPVFWIASIKRVAGYIVKVRYEGYDDDHSNDFWVHLCSEIVHPVGWCALNDKHLVPPKTIQSKYHNWKEYLLGVLTGAWTLPHDFRQRVVDCNNNSWPLVPGLQVEVVNKMCLSTTKVATIEENKGGRLKLRYIDSEIVDDFFWCHCLSNLIHPVGWSSLVSHKIEASADYKVASLSKATFNQYHAKDATFDMFNKMADQCKLPNYQSLTSPTAPTLTTTASTTTNNQPSSNNNNSNNNSSQPQKFQLGMKLEAVDPLNLGSICVATVVKILKRDYIMVSIDGATDPASKIYGNDNNNNNVQQQLQNNSFCYYAKSPYILPVGFCKVNNLELTPPRDHKTPFDWYDYLQETRSVAAPVELFNQTVPKHGYQVGMKVEAVDLMDPKLICVATITTIVGRLMKIHFDGWEVMYDQWVDCQSPDIYPVGWCQLFNHNLEAPKPFTTLDQTRYHSNKIANNKKANRSHLFRGGRKRKRMKAVMSELITGYATTIPADDDDEEDDDEDDDDVYNRSNKRLTSSVNKQDASNAGFFSESSPVYSPCEESDLDLDPQKPLANQFDDPDKKYTAINSSNKGDNNNVITDNNKLLYTSLRNSSSSNNNNNNGADVFKNNNNNKSSNDNKNILINNSKVVL